MNQLSHKAKRLFQRMTLREQLLALLFILVMLAIWTGSLINRSREWSDGRNNTADLLAGQQSWFDNEAWIKAEAATALERLEPSRTYSGPQLPGKIDNLLHQAGLSAKADIDPVKSQEGEIYNQHNLRVHLKRISIAELIKFSNLLLNEAPYINQQNLRISSQKGREEILNARFEIYSIELIPSAF